MKCLRCQNEMKHYEFNQNLGIYGAPYNPNPFSIVENQKPHNPKSIYICDNCGYVEFSMNPCENPDV